MWQIDLELFRSINSLSGSASGDAIFSFLTYSGSGGVVWILAAILLLAGLGTWVGLSVRRSRSLGAAVLLALAAGSVVQSVLKSILGRPRPSLTLSDVHLVVVAPDSFSFPSGHALTSIAAAYVMYRALRSGSIAGRWVGRLALILAILISSSRIYVGVHYPSDVLAGAVLGIGIGEIVRRVEEAWTRRSGQIAATSLR